MNMSKEAPSMTSRPITYVHKIPISKTQIFWDKLKEGKVFTTRCKTCRELYYPPQTDCPRCLASDAEWVELNSTVILETYTHVQVRPQGFIQYDPYTIAIGRTMEGVKVMGWLEHDKPEVGLELKMTTKKLPDGYSVIIFVSKDRT
jgi:uncharacterized OB-fold protein